MRDWIIAAAFTVALLTIGVLVSEPVQAGSRTTIQDLGGGMTIVRTPTDTHTCIDMGGGFISCN